MDDWQEWFDWRSKQISILAMLLISATGLFLLLSFTVYNQVDIVLSKDIFYNILLVIGLGIIISLFIIGMYGAVKNL